MRLLMRGGCLQEVPVWWLLRRSVAHRGLTVIIIILLNVSYKQWS